ncbi:MAG TPA: SigE family RNA polymerase sigma factor [Mycobacteriales bacterium]|nr:SigE family RNA polymerase sigma factor [Mycobacteriales bacterium]
MSTESDAFGDFVVAHSRSLLRTGWLLTGDWALAQDLVQTALAKVWTRWSRITRTDAADAYTRRALLTTYLSWRRRRWHGEIPAASPPDRQVPADHYAASDLRDTVRVALSRLPQRQRAVVVLRYFCDLTEPQTAAAMGCSVGTVKSHHARALTALRAADSLGGLLHEEDHRDRH